MEWIENFFDKSYFKRYIHLNPDLTSMEVDFFIKIMELTPEHEILDIPCGFGRHAIELTRRGFRVTGMEYHPHQIEEARKNMKEQGFFFPLVQADMRNIPHENRYDRLYNWFTSFGFFNDEENEKTVAEFYKALKPGGIILMDTINRDWIIKNFLPFNITRHEDGSIMLEERKFDPLTSLMRCVQTLIEPDGSRTERPLEVRIYSAHELTGIMTKKGFQIMDLYGRRDEKFDTCSPQLMVLAKK